MGSPTLLFFRTFFCFGELTKFRGIEVIVSPLVFDRVAKITAFVVVRCIFLVALYSLEISKIQVFDVNRFSSAVMEFAKSVKIAIIVMLRI
jgi:hypothetical protein